MKSLSDLSDNVLFALVGREAELQILTQELSEAGSGRTRVVILVGEPGIGKTSLLTHLAGFAHRNSWTVLRGGSSQAEGMPPYLSFLEAFGHYIQITGPETLRRQTGNFGPILATILPELTLKIDNSSNSVYPLVLEQSRLRLFEAAGSFIKAISADQPLLLLLDDLQWADSATLDLFCYFVEHNANSRILIAGAYRDTELAANPALENALLQLNRLRMLSKIQLQPLAEEGIGQLADLKLKTPLTPALQQTLYRQSEGNPFFAEELLLSWAETGLLSSSPTAESTTASIPAAPAVNLPAGIASLIRQRLARFTPETLQFLQTAAIIGRNFDLNLLAEVVGKPVESVEDSLVDALKARLIQPVTDEVLSFSHDKIRETLYAEVTPLRRKRLHGFIGRALELPAVPAKSPLSLQRLADLAFHFSHSGDQARGANYAIEAAVRATQAYAFEVALRLYQTALDLLEDGDPRRGELLLGQGEAALLAGNEGKAQEAFNAAQAWYLQNESSEGSARAYQGLGRAWWRLEKFLEAEAAFQQARARLESLPVASSNLVSVLVDLSSMLAVGQGRLEEGLEIANTAVATASKFGEKRLEASTRRNLGNLLVRSMKLKEGIALLEQALELAKTVDDPAEAAECCACLTVAYMWSGSFRRLEAIAQARIEFALRCNEPYQLRHVYILLGMLYFMQGKKSKSAEFLALGEKVALQVADPEPMAFLQNIQSVIAYMQGDFVQAEALIQKSLATYREMGWGALVWYLPQLTIFQYCQGKEQEALEGVAEIEKAIESMPPGNMAIMNALTLLTELVIKRGDRARAERYYPLLLPCAGLCIDIYVDRLLAGLEILLGDLDAARQHLDSVEIIIREEGVAGELIATLATRGDLELASSNQQEALELYNEGLELARQKGLRDINALRIEERLAALSNPAAKTAPEKITKTVFPAGLSRREVEVLRLVAAGKSNRVIAQELALSDKTVGNHIASILSKTGTDNRAGAAAFAIRYGLA